MSNIIIGIIVFAAFARAAREYNKSAFAWGAIGLAAFFIPQFAIAFLVGMFFFAGRGASLLLLGDFIASAMIAAWTYNKLMNLAIDEMAARDAAASAPQPPRLPSH
jgi:hypothetical protein